MMTIEIKKSGSLTQIFIKGTIKTAQDSANIKNEIAAAAAANPTGKIEIHILESFITTSSLIGFILKFINVDKMDITVFTYNEDLHTLLKKMKLLEAMNVVSARA